jgi:hypothetical protein
MLQLAHHSLRAEQFITDAGKKNFCRYLADVQITPIVANFDRASTKAVAIRSDCVLDHFFKAPAAARVENLYMIQPPPTTSWPS